MNRWFGVLILPSLFVVCVWLSSGAIAPAADAEDADSDKRAVLWKALTNSLTNEDYPIDSYAENPSLTTVLFRSHFRTMRFSLQDGKVEQVMHMKKVGMINRITFEEDKGLSNWVLWSNGQRELTIGDSSR